MARIGNPAGVAFGMVVGVALGVAGTAAAGPAAGLQAFLADLRADVDALRVDVDALTARVDSEATKELYLPINGNGYFHDGIWELYTRCWDDSDPQNVDYSACCPVGYDAFAVTGSGFGVLCQSPTPKKVLKLTDLLGPGGVLSGGQGACVTVLGGTTFDMSTCCPAGYTASAMDFGDVVCIQD